MTYIYLKLNNNNFIFNIFNRKPESKLLIIGLFFTCLTYSQTTDIARIEYTTIPQSNSENSIIRFRGFVNYPFSLGWEGSYIIPGIEYRYIDLDIEDSVPFNVNNLGKFEMYRIALAYTFKFSKEWRIAVKGGVEIASNFEKHTIIGRDVRFTGAVYFIKDQTGIKHEKPRRIIVGIQYSTNAGRPFPLPILNYYKKFHTNWSYSLGTPKTNLKYFWKDKNALQSFVTVDGFFSNIQNNLDVHNQDGTISIADNISMTIVVGGLGYEHFFTKHLLLYVYGGRTLYNEIRLRDINRNTLYKINDENTFYLRTGIKFKL